MLPKDPDKIKEYRELLSIQKQGSNNPTWKGDNATKRSLHRWVEKRVSKPDVCPMCQKKKEYMELHNIWGTYRRIISEHEWVWLCRSCHNHVEVHKRYHPQIRHQHSYYDEE